jgi:steroid delta-isomerase-like uncharacterized protein
MTADEARELAARWREAWNSRRAEAVLGLCADDVLWQDPLTERREQGRDAVQRYLESLWTAFPDMELEWVEAPLCSIDQDRLACRWRMNGTMLGSLEPQRFAPTGRRLDAEGVDVFELADGLVRSYDGFFDARAMAQQLGLMPAAGSATERVAVAAQRLTARVARRVA